MKVLWILNMVLPNVARQIGKRTSSSGGWLVDFCNRLSRDPNFEVATFTYADIKDKLDVCVDGIRNFIFPGAGRRLLFTSKKTEKDLKEVIDEFKPDLIHIHGTEYSMGFSLQNINPSIPCLYTIQGILSRISKEYYGGLRGIETFKMTTFNEFLRMKNINLAKRLFVINAKRERKVLKKAKFITGRTNWDMSVIKSINPNIQYFKLNYNLREEFYSCSKWDATKINKYQIYCGGGTYPLKGMHVLFRALESLVKQFPDTKLIVPGGNAKNGCLIPSNGYEKFLLKLIKSLNISNNVIFVGRLTANEVIDYMLSSHVCVVSSAMEGASATICEAMFLGIPCVCSYRGGMTELFNEGSSGFFYDFEEYPLLSYKIGVLFDDMDLCETFSRNSKAIAMRRHDRERNYQQLISIYKLVEGKTTYEK